MPDLRISTEWCTTRALTNSLIVRSTVSNPDVSGCSLIWNSSWYCCSPWSWPLMRDILRQQFHACPRLAYHRQEDPALLVTLQDKYLRCKPLLLRCRSCLHGDASFATGVRSRLRQTPHLLSLFCHGGDMPLIRGESR